MTRRIPTIDCHGHIRLCLSDRLDLVNLLVRILKQIVTDLLNASLVVHRGSRHSCQILDQTRFILCDFLLQLYSRINLINQRCKLFYDLSSFLAAILFLLFDRFSRL